MELVSTPEQKFIIMLQERISTLEDELLRLEKCIENYNASRYHKIDIKTPFHDGDILKTKINEILNHIFQHRKIIEPVFAAWNWCITYNQLLINIILTTKNAITEEQMKKYINHPNICYSHFKELYLFIQYFQQFYHDEDEGDTYYCYEYWHSHYGFLQNFIEYEFTDEPFTQSKNYNDSAELQRYLRKWIFNKENSWVYILRIFL